MIICKLFENILSQPIRLDGKRISKKKNFCIHIFKIWWMVSIHHSTLPLLWGDSGFQSFSGLLLRLWLWLRECAASLVPLGCELSASTRVAVGLAYQAHRALHLFTRHIVPCISKLFVWWRTRHSNT